MRVGCVSDAWSPVVYSCLSLPLHNETDPSALMEKKS